MSERPTCVDCGAVIEICEHAASRLLEPERSFHLGVVEQLRADLAAEREQAKLWEDVAADLTERLRVEGIALAAITEQRDRLREAIRIVRGSYAEFLEASQDVSPMFSWHALQHMRDRWTQTLLALPDAALAVAEPAGEGE